MKRLALIAALISSPALAQQPTSPPIGNDPAQAALGQEVMECVGGRVQLRARIIALEAELAKTKEPLKAAVAP